MLARIEIKGNLAPIQEYGRHQNAAAKKRKDNQKNKNKETADGEANQPEQSEKDNVMYDDKFYDLDDGFIDDNEIVEEDCFGAELGEGAFNSQFH